MGLYTSPSDTSLLGRQWGDWKGSITTRLVMEGSGNDDTIKRSIIRSIVRRERKSDRRSSSECLDLRLSSERLLR